MIILYIKNEHCTSVAQLKGYFSEDLTPESDIYRDLLDYGRPIRDGQPGDIAVWLREMDEPELASKVEAIDTNLNDSAFYAQLKAAITGSPIKHGPELKPTFERCFSFEGLKCDVKDNEAKVIVSLKVLMCVNEKYKLSVSSNWWEDTMWINPYSYPEGKTACFVFTFSKSPGKDIGEITVMAEGKVLSQYGGHSDEIIVVGNVKFKMIHVEGGTFTMGATSEQENPSEYEKPLHEVTLSSYSIGETPVTQEQWQAVMRNNPSRFKGAQLPVECVSWYDCQEFIMKLNEETGRQFRLLTEAEWEFAARGGRKSKHYQYSGSNDINEVAWYYYNSHYETSPVKTKKPNELGIYDMSGNVGEWCQDWYGSYPLSSQTNPSGPASGTYRVCRGGGSGNGTDVCRLSSRNFFLPYTVIDIVGFRLAISG